MGRAMCQRFTEIAACSDVEVVQAARQADQFLLAREIKLNSGANPHDIHQLEARLDDIGAARGFLLGRGAGCRQMSARVWTATLEDDPGWLPD